MSRIGNKIIAIPKGIKVEQNGLEIKATGLIGSNQMQCHPKIKVTIDTSAETISVVNEKPDDRQCKQLHGTMRALIANLVEGVSKGFVKKMQIFGTGYSVKDQGGKLVFQIGFCHTVERKIPDGVKVTIKNGATRGDDTPAVFTITGIDKCVMGQFAAELRKIRPPEPYKGKGIRYADEVVRRKAGKAFASGAA